mmetsp:Transcript_18947/g.52877  ORF Transcript_18947/g.52877 Transcript_18947/m.52877 type:complete len:665 (-) Transcript_18947:390-2384(-)|eukprot:CAMPEP_0172365140 /NCGR_PEP_ID=MMETSP1060-20121228/8113_1 /TAXON_ID=37318 /ORGANISM="Pseudo-nitzschia pungens, Strain cf. cingulata" /LENGTH=664 /DNA_ID=CAMNT_0013088339 /DNA_START=153 /DNA_END=2147 /DNA_ORIENTATION=-
MSNNNNNDNKPPLFCLLDTETTILQKKTEKECQPFFVDLSTLPAHQKEQLHRVGLLKQNIPQEDTEKPAHWIRLLRPQHRAYLEGVWRKPLKAGFVSLDSSRPWMLYWCLHGYDLLSDEPPEGGGSSSDSGNGSNKTRARRWITPKDGASMVSTLEDCWQGYHTLKSKVPGIVPKQDRDTDENDYDCDELYFRPHEDDEVRDGDEPRYYCGGFGGGPGQMAHAATTYAAVLALCILATSPEEEECEDDDDDESDQAENAKQQDDPQQPLASPLSAASKTNSDNDNDDIENNDDEYDDFSYRNLHYSERAKRMLREIRIPLYRWMTSLQVPNTGGYRMQHDGEVDVRATYTIACCSKLLGILTQPKKGSNSDANGNNANANHERQHTVLGRSKVVDFVRACQTYEGGIGGEPFSEAHGGYTLCAVAALKLLGALHDHWPSRGNGNGGDDGASEHALDVKALLGWLSRRQNTYEGGFTGRSNKLVDGCYSFWQGGATAIASSACCFLDGSGIHNGGDNCDDDDDPWLARYRASVSAAETESPTPTPTPDLPFPLLYDVFLLERYILLCAQEITGGLRDKPSKPRDFYHTCYNLSGLSIAQHCSQQQNAKEQTGNDNDNADGGGGDCGGDGADEGFGDPLQTIVGATHPLYNIKIERVAAILDTEWE